MQISPFFCHIIHPKFKWFFRCPGLRRPRSGFSLTPKKARLHTDTCAIIFFLRNMLPSLRVWIIDRRENIEKAGGSVMSEKVRQFRYSLKSEQRSEERTNKYRLLEA